MMRCRNCSTILDLKLADLGNVPYSNAYIEKNKLTLSEKQFSLQVRVCENCWLVQTVDYSIAEEHFNEDYAYYSSTSDTWLQHAKHFASDITNTLELSSESFVVELASNDGYLLKHFQASSIPCLGVEPTLSTARLAQEKGIQVLIDFFGSKLADKIKIEYGSADLVVANNVYAHVPDINDFTAGIEKILKPNGTITIEFPHLFNLINQLQFDTIYHEHYSYLSLKTVDHIFQKHGLRVYKVQKLKTHGGSLRIFGCKIDSSISGDGSLDLILKEEEHAGLFTKDVFLNFQLKIEKIKDDLLKFVLDETEKGKKIYAYGAAAKGNTLLNFAGIKSDLIEAVFDKSPGKINKFLPGSHIPILDANEIVKHCPDYILILPWNLKEEITNQLKTQLPSHTVLFTAIPELKVWN